MKILVTGGLGLIGHNVVSRLEKLDHDIVIADTRTNYGIVSQSEIDYLIGERLKKISTTSIHRIDVSDFTNIDWLITKHKPNVIIHAASFPRQKVVNAHPQIASRVMSEGLLNLLESSVKNNVEKFVYISSSMVYGDFDNFVTEDTMCKPQGQYGIMKLAGEWLVRDYTRKYNLEHTILRPSAVYGPLDVEDRVISKFLLTAMRGQTLKVNGANEILDFTYVDDAADGVVASALSNNTINKTYNITKSHSTTLLEAAKLAIQFANSGTIQVLDKDIDFPSRGALNIDAARKDFAFDPKVDVTEGFEQYYNWLKQDIYFNDKYMHVDPSSIT
jgi:nucleoside-diphosphate-sugar epimerase